MQVILDSSFARPGSAPIWGRKKGEFRDWTSRHMEKCGRQKGLIKFFLSSEIQINGKFCSPIFLLEIKAPNPKNDERLFPTTQAIDKAGSAAMGEL